MSEPRYATIREFCDSGLLWWCNSILHPFGWTLVAEHPVGDDYEKDDDWHLRVARINSTPTRAQAGSDDPDVIGRLRFAEHVRVVPPSDA